jgi:predicted transcriptional regulator
MTRMGSMIAFRADKDTEKMLQDAARLLKKTKTEILREALLAYLEGTKARGPKRKKGAPAAIRESLGLWEGPTDSSVGTGQKFEDLLIESKRSRRL